MKVITATETCSIKKDDIKVFLAGGITNCENWQNEVIKELKDKSSTDHLILFNPRRENFPINDPNASYEQIEWEFNQLENMDIFSMYFANGVSDQPICMYELGRNIIRMQNRFPTDWKERIIITCEPNYKRKQDVIIQSELAGITFIHTSHVIPKYAAIDHANFIYKSYQKFVAATLVKRG